MVFVAGRAAFEMRAHTRYPLIGAGVGEFEFDVAVELVEALLAGQLGACGSDDPREEQMTIGVVKWG